MRIVQNSVKFCVTESRKRKSKDWEANDYYDSDEDTFLDRTGTIERKRANRMKAKNPQQQVETYNSLVSLCDQMYERNCNKLNNF